MFLTTTTAILPFLHYSTNEKSRFVMELILMPNKEWHIYWCQPAQLCQVYASCGAYGSCEENSLPFCNCLRGFEPKLKRDWDSADYSGGCVRKNKLHCGSNNAANGKRDKFLEMPSMSPLKINSMCK